MKSLIVKVVAGLLLFAGSLVGALAATGRLNHEGTSNIPLLNSFFPAPPAPPEGAEGEHGEAGKEGAEGAPADAAHTGPDGKPADAAHTAEPQEPQGQVKAKVGKSVVNPEKPAADPHGGGEHGGGGHDEAKPDEHGKKDEHGGGDKTADAHGNAPAVHDGEKRATDDMHQLEKELAGDRKNKYAPGGYFKFEGMPAGLTPEQINEAWQRVQGVLAEAERRKLALDLRERELQELADDISRRQHELGRERTKIEERHRELDARIQKFQEQVKLVKNDEVAALKRNAETLAAFEPEKAAQLVLDQWKTDRGQDEVLRTMEFMDKDAVNAILGELPNPMVQDLLKKRLRVSKESVPSAPAK